MLSDEFNKILNIAYTKSWDDFCIFGIIMFGVGTFVFFFGWFRMHILITYVLYLPEFILGSIAFGIYFMFTKNNE